MCSLWKMMMKPLYFFFKLLFHSRKLYLFKTTLFSRGTKISYSQTRTRKGMSPYHFFWNSKFFSKLTNFWLMKCIKRFDNISLFSEFMDKRRVIMMSLDSFSTFDDISPKCPLCKNDILRIKPELPFNS